VTVSPSSFDLAPGAAKEVTVVLDPGSGPFDAGSYWSAVLVQSSRLAPTTAGTDNHATQMRIVERIAVLVFADSAPESKPLPADVSITGIKRTAEGLGVMVNNPSAYMRLISSTALSITPLSGGDTVRVPVRSFHLLPGCNQELDIRLPNDVAGLGRTSVMAAIDYGAKDLVVGDARLTF
jgi:P pilus assembly chaperone PapD